MKEHVDRLFGKLRSSKGETLAELLVSVLVIVLGLTMFATAMMSSKKMLVKGDAVMQAYYTQRNILEGEETKDERNGRLILEQNGTGTDLGRSAGNEGAGKYRIDLYSDQEGLRSNKKYLLEQEHEKEWEYDEGIQKNKMSSEITGRYDADRNVSGCTDPFHDCYSYWRRCGCSKRSI